MTRSKEEIAGFKKDRTLVYTATIVLTVIIVTVSFVILYPRQVGQHIAAIVDQLSSSKLHPSSRHVNFTFISRTREMLETRFLRVDYFSDNATVDQYRLLSSYSLIVWRAHSALNLNENYVAISTSETYGSKNYNQYLDNGQLTLCNITGDPNLYFAITPRFIREVMSNRFHETIVIFMSCNGLNETYYETANSFVEKGTKAFISWDGWIDKVENDNAISLLLDYLISENNTIAEAVDRPIFQQSSPYYGPCRLRYYPLEAAHQRIPNYSQPADNNSWLMLRDALKSGVQR